MDPVDAVDLRLTNEQWKLMLADVDERLPQEACGLVAGQKGTATLVIPMTNELHSPVRYRINPIEQLNAFVKMEQEGLDLLAIYHSHPLGPDYPSATDVDEAYYPEALYLIWSYREGEWKCRAFWIQDATVRPARLSIE